MCRLFGMTSGLERARATFWLLDAPDSLSHQSERNPDGTGIGIYEAGRPRVFKQALRAEDDLDFAQEAKDLESTTFVAHVRHATEGQISLRNTHPFTMDGRNFAHNGGFGDLEVMDEHLGEDRRLVEGETDSERLFALITRETRDRGQLTEGLIAAIDWVRDNLPVLALNVVVTTEYGLWAVRYPETHSLYWLRRHDSERDLTSSEGLRLRGSDLPDHVIVASERLDDDPGWTEMEPGELLMVTPRLDVRREVRWPEPPRRRLGAS